MPSRFSSFDTIRSTLTGWSRDLQLALGFLTRLPLGPPDAADGAALGEAVRAFPLVGLVVGVVGGLVFALVVEIDLPALAAGLLAVAVTIVLTGGMHEDGLADTADGFGARADRLGKLAIMRDSRIGTFGTLALILSVSLRAVALAVLVTPAAAASALVGAHLLSRAALPWVMRSEMLARDSGLGAWAGRPAAEAVGWSLGLGAVLALVFLGLLTGLVAILVAAAATWLVAALARRQIGGYTGDVLGTVQQSIECGVLLAVAALH